MRIVETETLWKTLDILSAHALKQKQINVDFREYNDLPAVKLRFAYLQYPLLEFYALNEKSSNNRQLLLALAWLIGTQNILDTVVRTRLTQSTLGRECSYAEIPKTQDLPSDIPIPPTAQINNAIHLNGKVNYNIKQITELLSEKAKLVAKVHAASMNVSGLPHLSVSELAMVKHMATVQKNILSVDTENQLQELCKTSQLLEAHMKWIKKEPVFFEWMVTVIQEEHKSKDSNSNKADYTELLHFMSLLHYEIQKKFSDASSKDTAGNSQRYTTDCASRYLRTHNGGTETEEWLREATTHLNQETENLSRIKEELSKELKGMLQLIPSCIQI